MKNLIPYPGNPLEVYQNILESKRDMALKAALNAVLPSVQTSYTQFQDRSIDNSLESLEPNAECFPLRENFWQLYSYGSKGIRDFREGLQQLQPASVRYKCQYCTLTHHDSFDHILPQAEFPEYVVHPGNLLPTCSKCNGKKGVFWKEEGRRNFINLYLDKLPEVQYLFLRVYEDPHVGLGFEYYLENRNGIGGELFSLIERHYRKLDLLNRFKNEAITIYTELRGLIETLLISMDLDEVMTSIELHWEDQRNNLGFNYWKAVLFIALSRSDIFLDMFR